MKLKKHLFPYMLALAIILTMTGLLSANISFSAPNNTFDNYYNVFIDDVKSENIDIINYDNTNITYALELEQDINEYTLSFNMVNDSNFNVSLNKTIPDQIPDELKDIITYKIYISNNIDMNNQDNVKIEYILKNDLTNNEINILNKYDKLIINTMFNYSQI